MLLCSLSVERMEMRLALLHWVMVQNTRRCSWSECHCENTSCQGTWFSTQLLCLKWDQHHRDQDCAFCVWQLELLSVFKKTIFLLECVARQWLSQSSGVAEAISYHGRGSWRLSFLVMLLMVSSGTYRQHARCISNVTSESKPEPPCFHAHCRAGEWAGLWRDSHVPYVLQTSCTHIWALSNTALSASHLSCCSFSQCTSRERCECKECFVLVDIFKKICI